VTAALGTSNEQYGIKYILGLGSKSAYIVRLGCFGGGGGVGHKSYGLKP